MQSQANTKRTSPILIAAAWAVVLLPAGWGLRYTVQNALQLFAKRDAAATTPATPRPR